MIRDRPLSAEDIQGLMRLAVEKRMSEAFVARIKRDYVYTSDCRDAQTVMKLFKKWIKDYNNVAPHSGLGMKSLVEYRKSVNQSV